MLTYNPRERISAYEALNDSWIKLYSHNTEKAYLNENLLKNFQAFNGERKF